MIAYDNLIAKAKEATNRSYAPYSGFNVGAALICSDGKIFIGCNIENSSFSPTVCAERVAFFNAISSGYNKKEDFKAIAIACQKDGKFTDFFPPCGVCRQVMLEFCNVDEFEVVLSAANECKTLKLSELVPYAFSQDRMK